MLPLARPVQHLMAEPLGAVTPHEDLDRKRIKEGLASGESALANFLADALVARCHVAGFPVDFAFVDVSTLGEGLPQTGPLTYGNIFRLSPFADSIVVLRLPPGQLQALLDDNARRIDLPGERHEERGFLHFSREVRYRVDMGGLLKRSHIRAVAVTLDGTPIASVANQTAPLLVAYSSFVRQFAFYWQRQARQQGLSLFDIDELPHEVTRLAVREELVAYVRQLGGVTAAGGLVRDGRVTIEVLRP